MIAIFCTVSGDLRFLYVFEFNGCEKSLWSNTFQDSWVADRASKVMRQYILEETKTTYFKGP